MVRLQADSKWMKWKLLMDYQMGFSLDIEDSCIARKAGAKRSTIATDVVVFPGLSGLRGPDQRQGPVRRPDARHRGRLHGQDVRRDHPR